VAFKDRQYLLKVFGFMLWAAMAGREAMEAMEQKASPDLMVRMLHDRAQEHLGVMAKMEETVGMVLQEAMVDTVETS
jgi:hypothetical protein